MLQADSYHSKNIGVVPEEAMAWLNATIPGASSVNAIDSGLAKTSFKFNKISRRSYLEYSTEH